jgi:small-conductance mechanosensitive channel
MKPHQWFILGALLLLVGLAFAAVIVTGERQTPPAKTSAAPSAADLVDVSPLAVARELAPLAISPEEKRLAEEAARLGDEEIDLAFADGLREARLHSSENDPKYRDLNARIRAAQAAVDQDKTQIAQLKARLATAKPAALDSLQDQIALLEAQQAPDEDELEVAQQELIEAGGDREGAIQRQRAAHEASEDHLAKAQAATALPPVNLAATNLLEQVKAWMWLRDKSARLESAQQRSQTLAQTLQSQRVPLEQQVKSEASARQEARQHAAGLRQQGARGAVSREDKAAALASFHQLSTSQKLLSGFGRQLQDAQELSRVYGNWVLAAASQQRGVLHGMLRSLLWILLIILLVYVASRVADHFFDDATGDRKRLFTLRAAVRFALQVVGLLLVAFVVLGTPSQMPTILGLAGAGLTVALKDFIVGFFGWFVLMGRNGIRVGDWVEINGVVGEVTEIGLLRTVILETGNWTDTGHPTGRKVSFVNSFAIEGHFFNFSTTGQWLWDELQVLIPPGENPYTLVDSVHKVVEEETRGGALQAEDEWRKSAGDSRQALSVEPAIHLRPTLTGVELQVRYITSADQRFAVRSRMYERIVALLHGPAKTGT